MRTYAIVISLALAALGGCQGTQEVPEGRIDTKEHPEFGTFRPVAIAVIPVNAPRASLRDSLRAAVYERMFTKRYSPFKLSVVDARIDSDGRFTPSGLEWDATMEIAVSRWKPVRGTGYFAGDGVATLRHKTGEILWSCSFTNYAFSVPEEAGVQDFETAADSIAALLIDRLPELPSAAE